MSEQQTSHETEKKGVDGSGIEQSRAMYESLVNTLPLCLLVKDVEGRRLFANQTYLDLRGESLESLIGKRDEDLFPPDLAKHYSQDDRHVIETGQSLHNVEETIDRSGSKVWIERIKSPIRDSSGRTIGVQILFWDVSDRVSTEEELKVERQLLSTLMGNIPDSIYFKDTDSRFVRISEAMAKKFGLSGAEEAIGKTDADIFSDEHARAARADELQIMATGDPVVDLIERETWRERDDSWCMTTKMPFVDEDGKVTGTYGISRDITELKKYQDELQKAHDAANSANRAKSDFLANMSHEIRTPMNAIIGMSELLSQTDLNNEQHDYINLVRESADSLLQLLNEILDFSKIESRKLTLESIPFSIRDLIGKAGQTLSVRAAEKRLELACRVAPNIPDRLIGDPGRLRQIMINLIGNAIKFTDEGEVLVEVCLDRRTEPAEPGLLPLHFSVRDTGIGIPEELHQSVLNPFTQADASTTRRFGGTGLGLAISRQLIELMHGELRIDSQPGYGANFFFGGQFEPASDQTVPSQKAIESLEGLSVLLVDDNPTNLRILKEIFTTWRLRPTLVSDGQSALDAIDSADRRDAPFRLVVLDCMMPEMDGFELARRIRESHSREQTKLIILSSATHGDDVERCQRLDVSRYMTKPVIQSELLDTVVNVMQMRAPTKPKTRDPLPTCRPLRVLVAEDGLANQHVAVGMLQSAGHRAVVVADGRETVARWKSEPFDMILMDMHMPVMDGLEATIAIRAHEKSTGDHIPIIALTAAAMKEDAEACRDAGMDGYLSKPIHQRQLLEAMARLAPEKSVLDDMPDDRAEGQADDDETQFPTTETIAQRVDNTEHGHSIDLRVAASRVPGGMRGVRRLAEVFVLECVELARVMRHAIPDGDPSVVQRSAHTLKGSAKLFAADRVSDVAREIEALAKKGDLTSTEPLLADMDREVEVMLRALNNFLEITSE